MSAENWIDLGPVEELQKKPLQEIKIGMGKLALTYVDGEFGAVDGICIHANGSLGEGTLEGNIITCPLHQWKYDRKSGRGCGTPGAVARYDTEERDGHLWLNPKPL